MTSHIRVMRFRRSCVAAVVAVPAMALLCLCVFAAHVEAQQYNPFGEIGKADQNSKLNMHLCPKGEFEVGKDKWGKIVRVNMLKIKDWSKVPGVKKAWIMKGYEGREHMAFHPAISEVKDVDGDGKPDIFRCRSEHPGARIERLRYDDGGVVWQSEPLAALHGDESRLPVFDLDGNGRADFILGMGAWHWGSDSILFLMEGP